MDNKSNESIIWTKRTKLIMALIIIILSIGLILPVLASADDTISPTTTLTTSPVSSDGQNNWFKTTPSITFTRNEPGTTYYSWTSNTGPWTLYSGSFNAPEGENTLYYYSVDTANNIEIVKSQAFKVDTVVPYASIISPMNGTTISEMLDFKVYAYDYPWSNFAYYALEYSFGSSPSAWHRWWTYSSATFGGGHPLNTNWLSNGVYNFRLISADKAGNKSETQIALQITNNSATSWQLKSPEVGGFTDIQFSPNFASDQKLIASGAGKLFKSTDAGMSWSDIYPLIPDPIVGGVVLSPIFNIDNVMFAASGQNIVKSSDGGVSWNIVYTTSGAYIEGGSAISPNFPVDGSVIIGGYLSRDYGITWTKIPYFIQSTIFSPNYSTDGIIFIIVEYDGGIFKSIDQGVNWQLVNDGLSFSGEIQTLAISPNFNEDQTLYIGGRGNSNHYAYKSTDSGSNWSRVFQFEGATSVKLAISPNYAEDGIIYAADEGNGFYRSTDRGITWTRIRNGVSFLGVSPNFANDGVIIAQDGTWAWTGEPRTPIISSDRGDTWTELRGNPFPSIFNGAVSISPTFNSDRTLAVGANGVIYLSTDGGSIWTPSFKSRGIASLVFSPNYFADGTIFTIAYEGVMRTQDRGVTWTKINNLTYGEIVLLSSYSVDQTIFIGSGLGILKSQDGGTTWIEISESSAYGLAVSPNFVIDGTFFKIDGGNIYKSIDQGSNWTQVLQGLEVNQLIVSPNYAIDQTVFARTWGNGIYVSTDAGANWARPNTNSLIRYPNWLAISPTFSTDRLLFISTDKGIFYSNDNAANWNMITSKGLGPSYYNTITSFSVSKFQSASLQLFGTQGEGSYLYNFNIPPDSNPPITTLTTNPTSSNGNNGWFKTIPSVTLTRNEPGITYYSWNSSPPQGDPSWTTYSTLFNAPEGQNTLYYYSRDTAGNNEVVKSQLFKVDTQSPANFTQNLPVDGATVNKPYPYFSWNASSDATSDLTKYQLYINGSLARDNITNWAAAVPSTALSNGSHNWFVRVWDNAGNYRDSATRNLTVSAGTGKIAFQSNRTQSGIYIMNPDGSNEIRLNSSAYGPALSPDGSRIVYNSTGDEVSIMNSDGTDQTQLTFNAAYDFEPSFSPDGNKIIFRSDRDSLAYEIYEMSIDGTNLIRLTNNSYYDTSPSFSPDGKRIVFASRRSGNQDIYLMNTDGTNEIRLTDDLADDYSPAFSPDGNHVVYYSNGNTINIINVDGSGKISLVSNVGVDSTGSPSFSIDGNKIAFSSTHENGMGGIYVVNKDGSGQNKLSYNQNIDYDPSWGPGLVATDTTSPSTPANLNAVSVSSSQIDLSWIASTDNVGVTGYKIYNADNNAEIATTTSTSYSHTGLSQGTTRNCYVKAFDAAGNTSSSSNTASATTFAGGTDNTQTGTNTGVNLGNGVSLTFDNVATAGTTSVTTSNIPPGGPPSGFRFRGYYYNVTTTATYSGYIIVQFPYSEADITGNEASLKLFHWNGSSWEDVTVSVDTVNNVITGKVTSLSPFGIGEPVIPSTGFNTYWLLIVAVSLMVSGGCLLSRREDSPIVKPWVDLYN